MGFETNYGLTLRIKHKDVLTLFKKAHTTLNKSGGHTDFNMTFADYSISQDGTLVQFPFLGKFSIQIRSLATMETGGFSKSNATIDLQFEVPGAILTNEKSLLERKREWDVIPMLIMAYAITNKPDTEFVIHYTDRPNEKLIIKNMVAIDFKAKDDFNPLQNMSFEGLSFSRKFAGITEMVSQSLAKSKVSSKKEAKPVNKSETAGKKKCFQKASKSRVHDIIKNVLSIQNLSAPRSIRLRASDEEMAIGSKTYKATLNPNGVDYKNLYLISDIASDSGGVIQLSSIFNNSTRVQTMQYTEKGLKEMAYDNSREQRDLNGNKIEDNKPTTDDSPVVVDQFINDLLKKLGEEDIISDRAMNLSRAFNINIAMDRAILGLNLFDRIEVSSSLLGMYDGLWVVTQVEYEYDNGLLSQTIKALPEPLSDISKRAQIKKYVRSQLSNNQQKKQ